MVMVDCLPNEKHRQPQKAFRSTPRSVIVSVDFLCIVFLTACMFFARLDVVSVGGVCDGVRSVW